MTFEIKKLTSADFDAARKLFTFFQIDDGIENPSQSSDEYLKDLLTREDFHVITVFDGENLVGGLTAYEFSKYKREEKEVYLYEIGVAKSYRRKGAARALIEFLKGICREKGIGKTFVGAVENNFPALKLYEATGGKGEKVVEFEFKIS